MASLHDGCGNSRIDFDPEQRILPSLWKGLGIFCTSWFFRNSFGSLATIDRLAHGPSNHDGLDYCQYTNLYRPVRIFHFKREFSLVPSHRHPLGSLWSFVSCNERRSEERRVGKELR